MKSISLLTQAKMDNLRALTAEVLRQRPPIPGAKAEVGVFRGGSARAMLEVMAELRCFRAVHLFDTFSGLPDALGPLDAPGMGHAGQWPASLQEVM